MGKSIVLKSLQINFSVRTEKCRCDNFGCMVNRARRTHAAQTLSLPGVPAPRKRGPGHYPRGVWAENLVESSGTEKGFAGARLASPLKGLGHRAHTCGERHGGAEQTAHRQRTDSAQTTHRQRTDSAQRLSCVFRKRKRRFKSDQP